MAPLSGYLAEPPGSAVEHALPPPARIARALPDGLTALLCLAGVVLPDDWRFRLAEPARIALFIDVVTLMLSGTLIDLATRVLRRPPGLLATAGLLVAGGLFYGQEMGLFAQLLATSWGVGWIVFGTTLWSVVQRFTILWTAPRDPLIVRHRLRAAYSDRAAALLYLIWTFFAGVVLLFVVPGIFGLSWQVQMSDFDGALGERLVLLAAGAVFAVGAVNAWFVHGPAFAARPRSLLPFKAMDVTEH